MDSYKKGNGKMLINAIKYQSQIMEQFIKFYYVNDLLELFADDEELCQLMTRLKRKSELCCIEDKINQLVNSIRDNMRDRIGGGDEILRFKRLVDSKYGNEDNSVKLVWRFISRFVCLIDAQKPRTIVKDFGLFNGELNTIMTIAIIVERLKSNGFQSERLKNELDIEKVYDKELGFFLLFQQFDIIYFANRLKNENEICENLKHFINNEELPEWVGLLKSLLNKRKNQPQKQLNCDIKLPKIYLCFKFFRNYLQSVIQKELNTEIEIKFIFFGFGNQIQSDIFSIFHSSFSNIVESFLNSYECQETKQLLSHFLPILTIVDSIAQHSTFETLIKMLVKEIENHRIQTKRDILHWVQLYSIADEEEDEIDNAELDCRLVEVKMLKDMFQLLLINNKAEFYEAIEAMDNLYLKRMLLIFRQHYPGIFYLFIFRTYQFKNNTYQTYFPEKYSFILELVWNTCPDIARCLLMSDYNKLDEYYHLAYPLRNNCTEDISLIFKILKPYPTILVHLILISPFYSHQNCMHSAILDSEIKTLQHFLMELNRNAEVFKNVVDSFLNGEEEKLNFYEVAEVKNPGALLIFLNNLKIQDFLRVFFLPADKSQKSAFYLAGERGCKEVIDTLLSALKSEPDTLWELLTWTEASTGKTVLHRACERGYVEIADALLNSVRERPELLKTLFSIQDKSQHTALDGAILSERQYIGKNFNKDLIDNSHYQILKDSFGDENCMEQQIESLEKISGNLINVPMVIHLILIITKNFNNVELMLAIFENADLISVLESMFITLNNYSYQLFECAIRRNSLELVKQLVHLGIDMNYTDGYGVTPLMRAVQKDRVEIVEFLIESGVDVYARDMHGTNAIALANSQKFMKMPGIFLKFVV